MDMRGHTGGVSSLNIGVLTAKSNKQKTNPRSFNESEVIGNSGYLPYNIWYEYFLEAQGHPMKLNILWQDNEVEDKMVKKGKMSCSSKS